MTRRAAIAVLSLVLAGCGVSDLAFVEDRRVSIVSPDDGARVRLPVTLSWRADDLDLSAPAAGDGVFFGVFVDRPPIKAGESLESLVGDDCRTDGCADLAYFAGRDVHLTADTELVLHELPPARSHQVTIILIDQQYRRVGESAFVVEFSEAKDDARD